MEVGKGVYGEATGHCVAGEGEEGFSVYDSCVVDEDCWGTNLWRIVSQYSSLLSIFLSQVFGKVEELRNGKEL